VSDHAVLDCADDALLWTIAQQPSAEATTEVLGLWRALLHKAPSWLVAAQPGYTSLHVVFAGADACAVREALLALRPAPAPPQRTVEVPVRYGGAHGPDLSDVAAALGLTPKDVIARHQATPLLVAFLGFQPGFAYLLGLNDALHLPRRPTPRPRVPAGSVGIGGGQTGVYPTASPGGWHLIGHTELPLPPGWASPGDQVWFRAVGP
jgi:5-oxoprolinase (ATP-hydrolysing) subunit B